MIFSFNELELSIIVRCLFLKQEGKLIVLVEKHKSMCQTEQNFVYNKGV